LPKIFIGMKRIQLLSIAILTLLLFNSCGSLKAPAIHQFSSIDGYRYVFITPTAELTSSTGVAYAVGNGLYGNTSKTINPSDVISGIFLKNGFIRLPELKPDLLDQTIVVNYGESGRRNKGLGYTIEVTIQILSAKTSEPICICTAEGQGETEADDVRIAINRALSPLFGN
jgi:hypothetical protein